MTTSRQYAEHEGAFGEAKKIDRPCPKCGASAVTLKTWESSDGAYEDEKFTCGSCGYVWWVEGPDA